MNELNIALGASECPRGVLMFLIKAGFEFSEKRLILCCFRLNSVYFVLLCIYWCIINQPGMLLFIAENKLKIYIQIKVK